MAWGTISNADVESVLNVGEIADYRKHCIQIADPLPTIINDVTHLVRGYVATRWAITEAGIPDELRAPSLDIIVYRLIRRVRGDVPDGDARRSAAEDAEALLKSVREGTHGVFGETSLGAWGSKETIEL